MKKVFILATCRKPELAPFTELVFKTLRIGFPTADIHVHANGDVTKCNVIALCEQTNCSVENVVTNHHEWIEGLIKTESEPFCICDTDIIFYSNFEQFNFTTALAGWRIPEWEDEFSGAVQRARYHTSLLYVNPVKVREQLKVFESVLPNSEFTPTPFVNPVYPATLPFNRKMYFYDTCAFLYHALGGTDFKDQQKDTYFHFNFGSLSDIVLPRLSNAAQMVKARAQIMENPELGRGMWRAQEDYYAARPIKPQPDLPTPPIALEDAKAAMEWNVRLCQNDPDAMAFNDVWHNYCHGIDDLVDSMQDGRPTMSKEQIVGLFATAAMLYNMPFYRKYREMLFPVVLLVTNTYADSVAWEKSPVKHKRIMGDVMRICGDEIYLTVAAIKGGWSGMRQISPDMRERDWLGHHDKDGNII